MASALPSSDTPVHSSNLANFNPCQHTFVATRTKQEHHDQNSQREIVPRVCRLRTRDNSMAIYALVDPIDTNRLASDVSVNLLVEQLSEVSFDDESYKEKINDIMQKIFYEIENRLLQMTFDQAEEKISTTPSSGSEPEKLLPSLDEAESGAFLFAATVTQSYVYIGYVGTIRAFLVSNNNGELSISNSRPQYYQTGSLHTIDNDDEYRRLKSLDVDLEKMKNEGLDRKSSKFTRCVGKLSEKLLSSAASANDVNEARCNPLICEPTVYKFKIFPGDYALVLMTDKLYQMYLKTSISEQEIPSDFLDLLRDSLGSPDCAEHILSKIEKRYHAQDNPTHDDIDIQDMGLLIHFFLQPKTTNVQSSMPTMQNHSRRICNGEVTVDEVRKFINKHKEMQERREKDRSTSRNFGHIRETQKHNNTIEPFVRFDTYEKLLNDNEDLRQANALITELLYTQSTSMLEEKLDDFLKTHPSLKCD
ncbi:unnamed protein product [Adineta ricciae]|uniref:PPM-type phosphatase domain-containing protein n=1 Tax=Adineta ricciae TaxID=249248 RepID=A0A814TUN8_ADIRI|nr:unnamed protein product [Adineta ricciae]CAF1548644.1 unnamed protein product [Adineta ricciae]